MIAWLSRQSLPRFLGILLGNSRELEIRLAEKDREIERLAAEIEWWRAQYTALTDSFLLARGNRPVDPAAVTPATNGARPVPAVEKYAVDVEAERVMEMLYYRPQDFMLRVEELEHSQSPRDQEILRRVKRRIDETPEPSNDGVVIGPAA